MGPRVQPPSVFTPSLADSEQTRIAAEQSAAVATKQAAAGRGAVFVKWSRSSPAGVWREGRGADRGADFLGGAVLELAAFPGASECRP